MSDIQLTLALTEKKIAKLFTIFWVVTYVTTKRIQRSKVYKKFNHHRNNHSFFNRRQCLSFNVIDLKIWLVVSR